MQATNEKLKRYLFLDLSDEEMESIDLSIISDEIPSKQLALAEQELIEDYLEGNLSEDDKDKFRDNFMKSGDRRELLNEVMLLKRYAINDATNAAASSAAASNKSFLSRFLGNIRPLTAALAVLAIGFIAFAGWKIFISSASSPLETEYAVLNRTELLPGDANHTTVQLASGTMRDSQGVPIINASTISESVMFRLALLFSPADGSAIKAELMKDGKTAFTVENGRIYATGSGSEVRILMPRSVLGVGRHDIKLTDRGKTETALVYSFAVQ